MKVNAQAGYATDLPGGSSQRTRSMTPELTGETDVLWYPVAGSCQTACSLARTSRDVAPSARAKSVESVRPNAPERRPRRVAVGLDSPRSTLLIIALETPDRSARWSSDQPRTSRSALMRFASRDSTSLTLMDICPLYKIVPVKQGGTPHAASRRR